MNSTTLLRNVEDYAFRLLQNNTDGHDWLHIQRVYHNAAQIMNKETCDRLSVQVATLLHDIGDPKIHQGIDKTDDMVRSFLHSQGLNESFIQQILSILKQISFSNNPYSEVSTIEAAIVQDADRLDAIGAIGIARAFTYGGSVGQPLYLDLSNCEEVRRSTIDHFHDKLLKIEGLLHTDTAKKIAQKRHAFMVSFLAQFELDCHLHLN